MSERVDVQQLRDLLDKAAPRPWLVHRDQLDAQLNQARVVDAGNRLLMRLQADPEQVLSQDDVLLIVAAVNSLPALLARLDALEEVAEAAKDLLDYVERSHGGDPSLTSEHYYIVRDYARVKLARLREGETND